MTSDNHTFEGFSTRRVSYVLATKNRATQLREALTRCRALVGPEDELIVVDGCSDDDTDKVTAEFSDLIDVYISEPDAGDTEAYNKGFLLARGKYIKHLTDDDTFYPEAMEQAVEVMEENPEVDMMVCGGTRVRDGKESFVYVAPGSTFGRSTDDVYRYTRSGCAFFFRRRLLYKAGLFDTASVSADGALMMQAISAGATVKFCRINLFYHPLSDDSFTIRMDKEKPAERDRLVRRYCSKRFQKEWFRGRSLPWRALRLVRRLATTGRLRPRPQKRPTPIWDGGFS